MKEKYLPIGSVCTLKGINKKIMTIELLDYIDDTEEQRLNKELDDILNMPDLPEEPEEPIESA